MEPTRRVALDPSQFRTNAALDYTMVGVLENPGDAFGFVDLSTRNEPTVNDYVGIIQHPNGGPKQISFTDNKVAAVFGDRVQYQTDRTGLVRRAGVQPELGDRRGAPPRGRLTGPDGTKYFTNEGILVSSIVRDAADFLGVSDALYDLSFGELRSALVRFVDEGHPAADDLASVLLRERPRLSFALDEWPKLYGRPGDVPQLAALRAGTAIGAALRQWARADGHESIAAAVTPSPPPSGALVADRQRVHRDRRATGLRVPRDAVGPRKGPDRARCRRARRLARGARALGGTDRRGTWLVPARNVVSIVGGAELDLSSAELSAPEIFITCMVLIGGTSRNSRRSPTTGSPGRRSGWSGLRWEIARRIVMARPPRRGGVWWCLARRRSAAGVRRGRTGKHAGLAGDGGYHLCARAPPVKGCALTIANASRTKGRPT